MARKAGGAAGALAASLAGASKGAAKKRRPRVAPPDTADRARAKQSRTAVNARRASAVREARSEKPRAAAQPRLVGGALAGLADTQSRRAAKAAKDLRRTDGTLAQKEARVLRARQAGVISGGLPPAALKGASPKERRDFARKTLDEQLRELRKRNSSLSGPAAGRSRPRVAGAAGGPAAGVRRAIGDTVSAIYAETARDPIGQAGKFAKGAKEAVLGSAALVTVPAAVIEDTIKGEAGTLKRVAKGVGDYYSEQYGPSYRGEKDSLDKARKVVREKGAFGPVLDAATFVAPGAGAGARAAVKAGEAAAKTAKARGGRPAAPARAAERLAAEMSSRKDRRAAAPGAKKATTVTGATRRVAAQKARSTKAGAVALRPHDKALAAKRRAQARKADRKDVAAEVADARLRARLTLNRTIIGTRGAAKTTSLRGAVKGLTDDQRTVASLMHRYGIRDQAAAERVLGAHARVIEATRAGVDTPAQARAAEAAVAGFLRTIKADRGVMERVPPVTIPKTVLAGRGGTAKMKRDLAAIRRISRAETPAPTVGARVTRDSRPEPFEGRRHPITRMAVGAGSVASVRAAGRAPSPAAAAAGRALTPRQAASAGPAAAGMQATLAAARSRRGTKERSAAARDAAAAARQPSRKRHDNLPEIERLLAARAFDDPAAAAAADTILRGVKEASAPRVGIGAAAAPAAIDRVARALELPRRPDEPADAWRERVMADPRAEGLAEPGYAPSQYNLRQEQMRSASPHPATASTSRQGREGGLIDTGREDLGLAVLDERIQAEVMQGEMLRAKLGVLDKHGQAFDTPDDARRWMESTGKDPDKWLAVPTSQVFGTGDVADTAKQTRREFGDFVQQSTTFVVPRHVWTEVDRLARPLSGAQTALRRTMSVTHAALLGLSPGWAMFQVLADTTMLSAQGVPVWRVLRDHKLYKSAPTHVRDQIDVIIGGNPASDATALGADGLLRAHSIIATNPVLRVLRDHNPFTALIRMDSRRTDAFRRSALMHHIARAVREKDAADIEASLDRNMRGVMQGADKLVRYMGAPDADELIRGLADPSVAAKSAEHLVNAMGDWHRYTASEMSRLRSVIPFYGFLRYSARLLLYTLPVGHPMLARLILEVGRLSAEMQKDIIGDELPWALGRFYNADGTMVADLARAHPLLNSLTQAQNVKQAGSGLLPPMAVVLANAQFADRNMFLDRPYRVRGSASWTQDLSQADRWRIAAAEMLRWSGAYRAVLKGDPRVMGDDSLAFDRRPLVAKTEETAVKHAQIRRDREQDSALKRIMEELSPIVPVYRRTEDRRIARDRRARREGSQSRPAAGLGTGQGLGGLGAGRGGLP